MTFPFRRRGRAEKADPLGTPASLLAGWTLLFTLLLLQLPVNATARGASEARPEHARQVDREVALSAYAQLPMRFEANAGQSAPAVKFLVRGLGYGVFLTPTEMVLRLVKTAAAPGAARTHSAVNPGTDASLIRMVLVGGNRNATVTGVDELPGRANYFVGADPRRFRTSVPQYAKVNLQGVYPGIDLTYYGSQRSLEYDFVVAAGANPNVIRLEFSGAKSVTLDASGDLVLSTANGRVVEKKPYAYQVVDGKTVTVACRYVVTGRRVGFEIGDYDATRGLILDPMLAYSTFFGGTGQDAGYAVSLGPGGHIFVAGYTDSPDFPLETPVQPTPAGGLDGFVARLNAAGSALVYSTYLGGSGSDTFYGLTVDDLGNAYVTGQSDSPNFPLAGTPFQSRNPGLSAVVAKLDPVGALLYSTYLGDGAPTFGEDIALDTTGNVFVVGQTLATDFPVTPGALQQFNGEGRCFPPGSGGCSDGFITKFVQEKPDLWTLGYSTYFGGSGFDWIHSIALDPAGHAYVTGETSSDNLPMPGATQPARAGARDAFVAKLDPLGALEFSTYFGGTGRDVGRAIAVDPAGNIFVAGSTASSNLPLVNPLQAANGGSGDVFVAKWTAAGPLTYTVAYASYLGGSGQDFALAAGLDPAGNFYVAGFTSSLNFPVKNPFQAANKGLGNGNAFISEINPLGSALVYSSYLGGTGSVAIRGMAIDATGTAVVTGVVMGGTFPVVNAFQRRAAGSDEAFIARITNGGSSGGGRGGGGGGGGATGCGAMGAAFDILQSAYDMIAAARPGIGNRDEAHEIDHALKDLREALNLALWRDPKHPVLHHGHKVFDKAKDAVAHLVHLLKKKHTPVDAARLRSWIEKIELATRTAACQAIDDAVAAGGNPKEIQKAKNQLARADVLVTIGRHHEAIDHHRHAWHHALKSMR